MAVIDIQDFGGIAPSVKKRDLPPTSAQTATNVDTRYPDFRPTQAVGSSLATVASAAKSVFRLPLGGGFLSSTDDTDYVANPVQDDVTGDRVYLSGRTGLTALAGTGATSYPEAYDAGVYRPLKVPQPAAAPSATLTTEGFEFTADDASTFRSQYIDKYRDDFEANCTPTDYAGDGNALTALADSCFWLPHGTSTSPALPTTDNRMGCYCVPGTGSAGSFVVSNAKYRFAIDPKLGGRVVTYLGNNYIALPFYVRSTIYAFNSSAFQTAVRLRLNPQGSAQLIPDADLANIAADYTLLFNKAVTPRLEMANDLKQQIGATYRYVQPMTADMAATAIAAFYATSAVATAIDTAAGNLAETLYNLAVQVWNVDTALTNVFTPPGNDQVNYYP